MTTRPRGCPQITNGLDSSSFPREAPLFLGASREKIIQNIDYYEFEDSP